MKLEEYVKQIISTQKMLPKQNKKSDQVMIIDMKGIIEAKAKTRNLFLVIRALESKLVTLTVMTKTLIWMMMVATISKTMMTIISMTTTMMTTISMTMKMMIITMMVHLRRLSHSWKMIKILLPNESMKLIIME